MVMQIRIWKLSLKIHRLKIWTSITLIPLLDSKFY
jgi:hypothetical protein